MSLNQPRAREIATDQARTTYYHVIQGMEGTLMGINSWVQLKYLKDLTFMLQTKITSLECENPTPPEEEEEGEVEND